MSHIHTGDGQHDLTASAFIVLLGEDEPRVWLHRHRLVHKWLQFGGHVELHENPWQTLTHEIAEESGYDMDQLQILQPPLRLRQASDAILHPQPFFVITHKFPGLAHSHVDLGHVFTTSELPRNEIGEGEAKEMQTMTLGQIKAIPADEIPENIRESAIFLLTEILPAWERVDPTEFTL